MSTKARYFKIGLFVLSAITLAVIGIIVFGAGQFFREKIMAETYIDESVQGLEIGSPVKHRGVQVGTVANITFVRNEYPLDPMQPDTFRLGQYVLVKIALYPDLFRGKSTVEVQPLLVNLIDGGLRVRLASQGVTGTSYLEADYLDPERNPPLAVPWEPKTFYFPSAPSVITRISQSVDEVFQRIQKTDIEGILADFQRLMQTLHKEVEDLHIATVRTQVNQLLQEVRATNQRLQVAVEKVDVTPILANLQETTTGIKRVVERLDRVVQSENVQQTLANFVHASQQVKIASEDLPDTIAFVKRTFRRVDNLVASQQHDIAGAIEDLRLIADSLKELTDNAKRYPSQLLFGAPPPRPVEENNKR